MQVDVAQQHFFPAAAKALAATAATNANAADAANSANATAGATAAETTVPPEQQLKAKRFRKKKEGRWAAAATNNIIKNESWMFINVV